MRGRDVHTCQYLVQVFNVGLSYGGSAFWIFVLERQSNDAGFRVLLNFCPGFQYLSSVFGIPRRIKLHEPELRNDVIFNRTALRHAGDETSRSAQAEQFACKAHYRSHAEAAAA